MLTKEKEEKIIFKMHNIHECSLRFVDGWISNKRKMKSIDLEKALYQLKKRVQEIERLNN